MALTDVTHDAQDYVPVAEVEEVELYHPKTWLGKYVFSQDAKISHCSIRSLLWLWDCWPWYCRY